MRQVEGTKTVLSTGISVWRDRVSLSGYFSGHCSFGTVGLTSAWSVTSSDVRDVFVASYDTAGTDHWAKNIQTDTCGYSKSGGIAMNKTGEIYLNGQLKCRADFSGHPQNFGAETFFLSKVTEGPALGASGYEGIQPVQFYPNPTGGIIHGIIVTNAPEVTIVVRDLYGRDLEHITHNAERGRKVDIDLSRYAGGAYFIYLSDGTNISVVKQLKE
jgi:Mor family transcriptional regulator